MRLPAICILCALAAAGQAPAPPATTTSIFYVIDGCAGQSAAVAARRPNGPSVYQLVTSPWAIQMGALDGAEYQIAVAAQIPPEAKCALQVEIVRVVLTSAEMSSVEGRAADATVDFVESHGEVLAVGGLDLDSSARTVSWTAQTATDRAESGQKSPWVFFVVLGCPNTTADVTYVDNDQTSQTRASVPWVAPELYRDGALYSVAAAKNTDDSCTLDVDIYVDDLTNDEFKSMPVTGAAAVSFVFKHGTQARTGDTDAPYGVASASWVGSKQR